MEISHVNGCLGPAQLSAKPHHGVGRKTGWSLRKTINTLFGQCAGFAHVASTAIYTWCGKDREEQIPDVESLNRPVRGKVLKWSSVSKRTYHQTLEIPTRPVLDDEVSALSSYTLEEMEQMMTKFIGLGQSGKNHSADKVYQASDTFIPKIKTDWKGSLKRDTGSMDYTASCSESSEECFADDPVWDMEVYDV